MMKKIWTAFWTFPQRLSALLCGYPKTVTGLLLLWNAFSTSWATGLKVPVVLDSFGLGFLDFSINARLWVSHLQGAAHIPTWTIAVVTVALNGLVAFGNWQKTHHKDLPGATQ